MNLYPHAKNEALSLSFFLEIQLIQKSCNLIGQKHFGPYLRSQISQKIWDLCKNITNKSPDLPHSTSYSFVTQCQNLKKINALLPRKHLGKQAAMRKDRIGLKCLNLSLYAIHYPTRPITEARAASRDFSNICACPPEQPWSHPT